MSSEGQITFQDALAWITLERNATALIYENEELDKDLREQKKNQTAGMDVALQFLSNVWDGTKNDVVTKMIRIYEESVVITENGEPRRLTIEEFVEKLEQFRDEPYSPVR